MISITEEKGSAPRGCGAQMLVGESGRLAGTVGGGSLELQAAELAGELLRAKDFSGSGPMSRAFLLRERQEGGNGMVCGGDVTMLFQCISAEDALWRDTAEKLTAQMAGRKNGWLIQRTDCGAPSLLDGEGALLAGVPAEDADGLLGKCGAMRGTVFALPLPVGERAVIFGGGHCAFALVPLLKSVGFRVILVDCRPEFAAKERFPDAERVICGDYGRLDEVLKLKKDDFTVVMTHSHPTDALVLEWVLRRGAAYVGALGSRRKVAFIGGILREKNIPEEAIQSVRSPIGIGIKAATPEEIAVSITGEMILERATLREQSAKECAIPEIGNG